MDYQHNTNQKRLKYSALLFTTGMIVPNIASLIPMSYNPTLTGIITYICELIFLYSLYILKTTLPTSKKIFANIWIGLIVYRALRNIAFSLPIVALSQPHSNTSGIFFIINIIFYLLLIIYSRLLKRDNEDKSLIVLQIAFSASAIFSALVAIRFFSGISIPLVIYQIIRWVEPALYIIGFWMMSRARSNMNEFDTNEQESEYQKEEIFTISVRRRAIAIVSSIATFAAFISIIVIYI